MQPNEPQDLNENSHGPEVAPGSQPIPEQTSSRPDETQPVDTRSTLTKPEEPAQQPEQSGGAPTGAQHPFMQPPNPAVVSNESNVGSIIRDGTPKKRPWIKPASFAATAVMLLAGAYSFLFYLPNTPASVYSKSLSNMAAGYDTLTNYLSTQSTKHYKGVKTDGALKLTADGATADGNFSLVSDGKNAEGSIKLDAMGEKLTLNMRSITAKNQTNPDVYLQVTGIKSMLDSYGLGELDSLDGQWLTIDHTLLDTAASDATSSNASFSMPSGAQLRDAMAKSGAVNRGYLFSTNTKKAVLINKKFLGTSIQDGRKVYGYEVGYNKANLRNYVDALGKALDSSKLNAWSKKSNGKSLSQTTEFKDLKSSIDKAKTNYTFKLYIDAKTKLFHQVHVPGTADPANNYIDFGLNYIGGSSYPFVLSGSTKDGSGNVKYKIVATLDMNANKIDVHMTASGTYSGYPLDIKADFTGYPSNASVKVTVPKGTKPVTDVLAKLGLGYLVGSGASSSASQPIAGSNLFTLSQ